MFQNLARLGEGSVPTSLARFYWEEGDCLRKAIRLIDQWQAAGKTTAFFDLSVNVPAWDSMHVGADDAYRLVHMRDTYTVA